MNITLSEIFDSRIDLSDYLFHFTKGAEAYNTLESILVEKKIRDVRSRGYICFTESPLSVLPDMFDIFSEYTTPMYAPYGIAIRKEELFSLGARPVIYGLPDEKKLLHEVIQWRFEEYVPNIHDYSWLREWRIQSKEICLSTNKHFVITNTNEDIEKLLDYDEIEVQGSLTESGDMWPYYTLKKYRDWKAISIESIRENLIKTRQDIQTSLNFQKNGLQDSISLGSGW